MEKVFEALVLLVVVLIVLLFFGPIFVIASIAGCIEMGPLKLDLRKTRTLGRVAIAIIGLGVWLSIYVPALLWAVRGPIASGTLAVPTPIATADPSTPAPTAAAPATATSTPVPCVCESTTVDDTLHCLIHSEAQAAVTEDLALVQRIFAPDAVVFRGDGEARDTKTWENPLAYYAPAFRDLDFREATHFDIRQIEMGEHVAYYVSGSSGSYTGSEGTLTPYYNESPSEHWVFGKDALGCWVITRFEFNASHLDFP